LLIFTKVTMTAVVPTKETEAYPPPYATVQQGEFVAQQAYPPTYTPQSVAYPVVGQQQQTVVVAGQAPVQNVVLVQARSCNPQVSGVLPGFAFCKFGPGIIETFIRVSLTVSTRVSVSTVNCNHMWYSQISRAY